MGIEELQEAGVAEKGAVQGCGCEANPGVPFKLYLLRNDAQFYHGIAKRDRRCRCARGITRWGASQINAYDGRRLIWKYGIVRSRV